MRSASMNLIWAQRWHGLTAGVTVAALTLQAALIVTGGAVLDQTDPPGLATRLYQFCAYFTIQSNLLIAVGVVALARDPQHDGPRWRVVRLAGIVGITVTALVHFVLLRPLLNLSGLDYLADLLLHIVVPILAVLGWLLAGPRPRVTGHTALLALAFPVLWALWTLAIGGLGGWYPYPFMDPAKDGWGAVLVALVGITGLFLACAGGAHWLDRRLAAAPRPG